MTSMTHWNQFSHKTRSYSLTHTTFKQLFDRSGWQWWPWYDPSVTLVFGVFDLPRSRGLWLWSTYWTRLSNWFGLYFPKNFFMKCFYEILGLYDSPMIRVLGLVFAFNLLLLTDACTFCCLLCCCCWYSVNCLLLLLNCFFELLILIVDFLLFVVVLIVGFVENCLLLVIVALNCLLLKLLLLLLLESSIILCNWLKLLKSSNPCIDGDDIGDSSLGFQTNGVRWRCPQIKSRSTNQRALWKPS